MSIKKILIIDDEKYFCSALKKSLESRNFQVVTALEGKNGIKLAKLQKPDLILLDIVMPGMTGSQVAEELSVDPSTSSIPIIFVTSLITKKEIVERDGVIGGRDFIAKPFILDELITKISETELR